MNLPAILGALLLSLLLSPVTVAADKVVLQLKWEHQFQFAGYYAAKWQGFYAAEGLDVEIRPASTADGKLLSPVDELVAGRADFAIGALDILMQRDRGVPLVVLAPIFQRSPTGIFALQDTPLGNLGDLAQLKIAAPAQDYTRSEVQALFSAGGIRADQVGFVDTPPTVDVLLSGKAQAISTYSVSARYAAREQGVKLQELSPQAYGLELYGDTLYTHQSVIDRAPDKVDRFLRASLKGWEYALSHRSEMVQRISRELPRHLFSYQDVRAYNQAFADIIDSYMGYPYTEIGHNNLLRWQYLIRQLHAAGVLEHELDIHKLVYNSHPPASDPHAGLLLTLLLVGLVLLVSLYRSRRASYSLLLHVVSLCLIGGSMFYVEKGLQRDYRSDLEVDALQQLNGVAARLSGVINSSLACVGGMAAHIAANPQIDQEGFSRYARSIMTQGRLLRNMAAAPGMIVRMVYPLAGNEQVPGLDYRDLPEQSELALQARDSNTPIMAGPLDLVQGGRAFIIRFGVHAVDDGGESYNWGILSAPLMAADLYREAGLDAPEMVLDVAIRAQDAKGADGEVFYGQPALFNDPRSVRTTIQVGSRTWQLAAAPQSGWEYQGSTLMAVRGTAIGLAVLLAIILVGRQRQLGARAEAEGELRQNEALLREVSRIALINGWRIAPQDRSLHWSTCAASVFGEHRPRTIDQMLKLFPLPERDRLRQALDEAMERGKSFDLELPCELPEQEQRWLRCIGNARAGENPGDWGVTGAIQDTTERRRFSEVMQRQATCDLLTGLPNRSSFYEALQRELSDARRHKHTVALLFIDLDKFKPVNDSYGHAVGDQLLRLVAERLRDNLRDTDVVARISGDEFTVILPDPDSEFAPLDVAERLLAAIRQPFDLTGCQVVCGASIGIACYPQDGNEVDELISKADFAMYEVKKSGRNGCKYFTRSMQERSEQRHNLYMRLQAALANSELKVAYQPVVEVATGRMSKCEALVRWYDENGKMIPASEFIPLAEETSLVNDIDYFVLQRAADYIESLGQRIGHAPGLSINLSPRLFASTESALQHWLELAVSAARRVNLTVEITEGMLVDGSERARMVLDTLKRNGATIAIDDFGTGYSSLSYLNSLPLDYLKIDRSFVQRMGASQSSQMVVDTIISLAKNLGLKLIAEGVETPEQLQMLRSKGCDYVQGFLPGQPMTPESLEVWLRSYGAS